MDELREADEAVSEIVWEVVQRYRGAGILTWALLHQIESEVLTEAEQTGEYSTTMLNMLRAPDVMGYPTDYRAASFVGHEFVPIVFGQIEDAWNRVH